MRGDVDHQREAEDQFTSQIKEQNDKENRVGPLMLDIESGINI
jgi:hypothetical protein